MTNWLMKSEPDEFSITDLAKQKSTIWDGVRNYQARNFIREMKKGDLAFFYHSSCKNVGIAGVMRVITDPFPDPTAIDSKHASYDPKSSQESNRWTTVRVEFSEQFSSVLSLKDIRQMAEKNPSLQSFPLLNSSRLSVMPVNASQWKLLLAAAKT